MEICPMTPDAFIETARSLIGTRYAHQGRSRKAVDCVGLVVFALQSSGVLTADEAAAIPNNYTRSADGTLVLSLHDHCVRVEPTEMQPGDLVAIKYFEEAQHLMIVERTTQWGPFVIHAVPDGGVVHHMLDDHYLATRRASVHATFRLKKFVPTN